VAVGWSPSRPVDTAAFPIVAVLDVADDRVPQKLPKSGRVVSKVGRWELRKNALRLAVAIDVVAPAAFVRIANGG